MKINLAKSPETQPKNEKHTFLMVKLAVSYSIFLLVILFLTFYLHHASTQNAAEKFWAQNKSTFASAVTLLNSDLTIMDSYCRQITQDADFRRLAQMTDTSGIDFYLSGRQLKNSLSAHLYAYSELPVNSYFIYLRNTNYVLSVNSFTTEGLYYLHNYRAAETELPSLDTWRELIYANNGTGSMYSLADYVLPGSDDAYLYLINMNALTSRNVPATAGFHLSYSKLKSIFSGVSLENGGCIIALDNQSTPFFVISEAGSIAENQNSFDSSALAADLKALTFSDGYASCYMDGNEMHITRISTELNGLQYYLIQPESLCPPRYQTFFALFLTLAAILGLGLVLLLVRTNMQPILELDTELKEAITDRNQLQEVVEAAKPIIYNTYLRQLMSGSLSSPDEVKYIQSFLHLDSPDLKFYVMYGITYENDFVENSNNTEGSDNISQIIHSVLAKYFSYHNTLYLFSPQERVYALLLPFEGNEEDVLISIQEKVLDIHETLLEQYSIWFFTGIGLPCHFNNIWESYQQAKDASGYTSKSYIFLPYEMLKKNSRVYYYPMEFSSKLVQFITTGNTTQVMELFLLIHQENIEERALPFQLLKFLLSDIRNTLLKARFAITNVPEDNPELQEIDDMLSKDELTFRYCQDIALKLCHFFEVKSEKGSLIDNIVAYIRKNYKDPSLCLNKISDEFNISESYFSHMFKENMNINFSVYLEDLRLNEAARLIKEGNSNVTDISLEVGYNNTTSFRRAFKKKFGVTPSAMSAN